MYYIIQNGTLLAQLAVNLTKYLVFWIIYDE